MNSKRTAFVIGAGPVGLVTAWELLKNGLDVKIFEKQNIVGGMCRTWKWNDYLVDTGPHIFHTPDKNLQKFWEKQFGDLFVKGEFWCKNVGGDGFKEYWDYPLSWESIARYPTKLKKQILGELDSLKQEDKVNAKNYYEYVNAQVGPTLTKMFFTSYPEKIWGISTKDMTPEWAPKRVELRNQVSPFYHEQWNAVGKFGTGCIYERIEEKINNLGGKFYFNHTLEKFIHSNNEIRELNFLGRKEIKVKNNDVIISSLPITLTSKLLGYKSDLSFRGIKSVYVSYKKKSILPEQLHWLYYGDDEILFNRVTEPKKLTKHIAPPNKTYLTAEITFSRGDEIDSMSDDEVCEKVSDQLEKVNLAKKIDIDDYSTNVEPFVYPLMHQGYQEELAKTRASISKFRQLYSIGTGGDFNYADSQILFHKAFDTAAIICDKEAAYSQVVRQIPRAKLNSSVKINKSFIGDDYKPFIIAEAGMNHNGSLKLAKQLIDAAKKTNCDAIKFQTFKPHSRISSQVKAVHYAETVIGTEETLFEMFERLAMSFEEQEELFKYARRKKIEIFSTPFDFESVDFLERMKVRLYKIASMDLVNLPLIRHVAKTGKPMILSTGMSNLGQIEEAVEAVRDEGNPNLILLHCNSSYPAAPEEMNLNAINSLKECFKIPVGLSDHTFGLFISHTSMAIGANVIERHFTLDRTLEGPDHILSSEPEEMKELVSISKKIPLILGDGIKRIQPNEYGTLNTQRKSIYAAIKIKKGQIIKKDMLVIKGPGGGLLPRYLDIVIGRKAAHDIDKDYPITWEKI